jgi:hypothetical protein
MGERHQPRVMNSGDQYPSGNADRLLCVVVPDLAAIGKHPVGFGEDDDNERRVFKERLVLVGSERRQGIDILAALCDDKSRIPPFPLRCGSGA